MATQIALGGALLSIHLAGLGYHTGTVSYRIRNAADSRQYDDYKPGYPVTHE